MQVLKFGGSSVANATAISNVLDIVENAARKDKVILVSSAISGATDLLIRASQSPADERAALLDELKSRHYKIVERLFTGEEQERVKLLLDRMDTALRNSLAEHFQTFGERFSTCILAQKLAFEGFKALLIDSTELICLKNGVLDEQTTYQRIEECVSSHTDIDIFVAPGFIASDEKGVCTLGRGGSDYSAAIYAAAMNAEDLQIWTDVPGIMTTNPKEVKSARSIPELSYEAAFALASHGAKVLYAPTIEPARKAGIDIHILNSFNPKQKGTRIGSFAPKPHGEWLGIANKAWGVSSELTLVADGAVGEQEKCDCLAKLEKKDIEILNAELEGNSLIISVPVTQTLDALRTLHYSCFDTSEFKNIYLAGKGKVGTALLKLIAETGAKVEVKAISEHEYEDAQFFAKVLEEAAPNSVFVDCTDSESIWKWYKPVLDAGVNVVSSNRRALSVQYGDYSAMKRSARLSRRFLRYETTVGTALPILDSINTTTYNTDTLLSIEAIVSCTLNYVLTSGLPFEEALTQAHKIGLTEKDPSQDLLGHDAMRKMLILAREAGIKLEESDIKIEPVVAENICPDQRFVASLTKDDTLPLGYRAEIKLQNIGPEHPAARLKGTENMIIIRSTSQPTPLIIQGPGEGAGMAAAGVLKDILQ